MTDAELRPDHGPGYAGHDPLAVAEPAHEPQWFGHVMAPGQHAHVCVHESAVSNKWSYMLHYAIYLRYTSQNINNADKRGRGQQFGVPNWFMGMAQRKVGQRGLFQVRAMISLDALTVGLGGYPLLFQTGESYKGQPLIDKQHPHDLVSELSVSYSHAFSKDIDLYGYVGYPGEPAMGPPAFMHRISSFNNPDAPLSHHWQDATHILFGVATAGFRYKWAKVEASALPVGNPTRTGTTSISPRSTVIRTACP